MSQSGIAAAFQNPGGGTYGGGNSVQGGATSGGMFGPTITGPNAAAYNQGLGTANGLASAYANQGAGYTQQAAQAQNPYQANSQAAAAANQNALGGVGNLMMQTAQGQGPAVAAAQNQMKQATDQGIAAQTAMARSATGGALAQNAAQMSAQGNNAATLGTAASQSAQNLAQQEQAAAQGAGSVYGTQGQLNMSQYGLEQQQAMGNAQLAQMNQAQQNAQQLGYANLGLNEQTQGLNSLNGYNQANTASEGLAATVDQNNFGDALQIGSAAGGLATGGASGLGGMV